MNLSEVTLPLELNGLMMGFPRGIYEIETTGVDYEFVHDPVMTYLGGLMIDRNPGEPEPDRVERLSVVSFALMVGESGFFITQDEELNMKVRNTPEVTAIRLIRLYELSGE